MTTKSIFESYIKSRREVFSWAITCPGQDVISEVTRNRPTINIPVTLFDMYFGL